MEILGLDDKIYKWNPLNSKRVFSSTSSYHEKARKLLQELFPFDFFIEEVDLPGTKTKVNDTLRADFVILKHRLIIEVHGEQHYSKNSFFHSSDKAYALSKVRDLNKKKWCEINNFKLVELPYDDEDSWKGRIQC